MPLWKVYHPVGAYSAQDKNKFAETSRRNVFGDSNSEI